MSGAVKKKPPAPPPRRRLPGTLLFCLVCGLLPVVVALAPRLSDASRITAPTAPDLVTIPVRLTARQFSRPPTWIQLIAYYGLDSKLVEPTKLANSGADGVCPPEPIALPHDVVIALTAGSDKTCSPRSPG